MKRLGRVLGWVLAALAVVLAAGITFTIGWRPFIGPRTRALTARKFESTPARLARGEYLVRNVDDCMGCHAEHDWTAHDAPVLPNTLGAGQDMNILKGFPGKVYAPNITPDRETGAGNWSDDQLARAIREGVGHDGRALFPFMPYPDFRALSDEDLASVVVYLRSLPPVRKRWPATELIFPVKYLIRSVPEPLDAPGKSAPVAGQRLRTGGSNRETTDARSSSDRARKSSTRKQHPAVVADALANGPRQLVVAPVARARSRSDIRRIQLPGKPLRMFMSWPAPSGSSAERAHRRRVVLSMATVRHPRSGHYPPRARRAGVLSNFRAVSARVPATPMNGRQPMVKRFRRQNDRQRGERPTPALSRAFPSNPEFPS